ncbi:MAG: sigma-70 family RNA polymerase sigma factor [Pseudomonadales bacterium]|jgi:RNA polymerase sigma-70 factor (ECF subfamily)|nr:sigma-70 family RNA polymerase sigma factor [Pseudomonadales bacterium]
MNRASDQGEAFEAIVRANGALVARVAASYEARPALRDELAQEVFTAVWSALPTLRDASATRAWVARIAHNICVSHVRREARRGEDPEDPEILDSTHASSDEGGPEAVRRARLFAAVRALPLGQRQVVSMHLEGFSNREIGDALDLSEGNVAVRMTRAREALRRTLRRHEQGGIA